MKAVTRLANLWLGAEHQRHITAFDADGTRREGDGLARSLGPSSMRTRKIAIQPTVLDRRTSTLYHRRGFFFCTRWAILFFASR